MGVEGWRPLRVLAVDDSAVMRGVLRTVFELHASSGDPTLPRMELCGIVRDGVEALEAVRSMAPDVLLLDLEMPRMDGLEVLRKLRLSAPALPVIMCSAYTERGARATLDALSHGAKDYVMKPAQQRDFASALDSLLQELLPKIAALAMPVTVRPEAREAARLVGFERLGADLMQSRREAAADLPAASVVDASAPVEIVTIGVSTGGPSALEAMLPLLPADFPVPILIVQHMPRLFTGALAERLNRMCRLRVEQAADRVPLRAGTVLFAPGDMHMEVDRGARLPGRPAVRLHKGPPLNSCMPSADYLFRSAAAVYGAGTLAVVMTGMGSDGCEGAKAVRGGGGTVLAQDEGSSAVWGMPGRVVRAGIASAIVPLAGLAAALMERTEAARGARSTLSQTGREVLHGML